MKIVKKEAFTMIEILIVVGLIGAFLAFLLPKLMEQMGRGERGANLSAMNGIKEFLTQYRLDVGSYPKTKEGLAALTQNVGNNPRWQGPYLPKSLTTQDRWNNELIYNAPPVNFKDKYKYFELISYGGPDGESAEKDKWQSVGD